MIQICMIVRQIKPQVDLYQMDDVGAVILLHKRSGFVPPEIRTNARFVPEIDVSHSRKRSVWL